MSGDRPLEWFPFYVTRFLASRRVRRMDARQGGAFLFLMCEQWEKGAIPDDDAEIADIARCPAPVAREVLASCFQLGPDGWVNNRLAEIRTAQAEKAEKAAQSAKARWEKMRSHSERSADAMLIEEKREEEKRPEKKKERYTPEFDWFWRVHPRGSKAKACDEYHKAVPAKIDHPRLLACLEAYVATELNERFRGHDLFRWVRDERWREFEDRRSVVAPLRVVNGGFGSNHGRHVVEE